MEERGLFVDFMYAVTVGATLPRIDEKVLDFRSPLLWGMLFLIAVFLEDFFLYHVTVVPNLKGAPRWSGFILAMLVILTWYVSQAAFPTNPRLFLFAFAFFFFLKALGGFLMRLTKYPATSDFIFLFPVLAAMILALESDDWPLACHPGRLLVVLAPIWLATVVFWWQLNPHPEKSQ